MSNRWLPGCAGPGHCRDTAHSTAYSTYSTLQCGRRKASHVATIEVGGRCTRIASLSRLDSRQSPRPTACTNREVTASATPTQADAVGWILFKNPLGVESEGSDEAAERSGGEVSTSSSSTQDTAAQQQRVAARQRVLAVRQQRAMQLVEQLARCRRTPQIRLMKIQDKGVTRYTWDVDEGGGENKKKDSTATSGEPKQQQQAQQGTKLTFVLPWLVTTDKKLGLREIEYLGSQLRLSGLLQLDLARVRRRRVGMWCAQYRDGEELDRGSLVSATCALHRLVHRRGGLWPSLEDPSGGFASEESYLVVSYDEVGPQMLADVLAAYLHWFGGMTLTDAIKAATASAGTKPSSVELEYATSQLRQAAGERPGKVVLQWNWGGKEIRVAGDVVGGWGNSVPMRFYPRERCWRIQLWDLPPGRYHYKFIMDGKWVVDLSSPTKDDANGNKNNVVEQNYPVSAADTDDPVAQGGGGGVATTTDGTTTLATTTAVETPPAKVSGWQGALQPFFGGRKAASAPVVDQLPVVRLEASRIALDMKMRPMK